MKLLITGTPGTGKTALAKALGKKLGIPMLNEKDLALKLGLGKWDHDEDELVIPDKELEKAMNKELEKAEALIVEGHILCELKLKVDSVFVIRTHPEILELRLEAEHYKPEKVFDNVFVEGIDYCLKHALRNYGKKKVVEIRNEKVLNYALKNIIKELKERGLL